MRRLKHGRVVSGTPKRAVRRRAPDRRLGFALRIGVAAAVIGGLGAGLGWSVQSGLVARTYADAAQAVEAAGVRAGLAIDAVLVTGRAETGQDDILAALDVRRGQPILSVDLEEARGRLLSLPWVKTARIERRLPDTLMVDITERTPLALYQKNGRLALIDEDGEAFLRHDLGRFSTLPIVIGEGAQKRAAAALEMLAREPDLAGRVYALSWVGDRRWNLHLDDELIVQLPETDPASAWSHLASLEREHGVLARDVHTVDLRIPDQLIVRSTPGTVQRVRAPGQST